MADVYGVSVTDLPDDFMATGVVVYVKGIDVNDASTYSALRVSGNITAPELIGIGWTIQEDAKSQVAESLGDYD